MLRRFYGALAGVLLSAIWPASGQTHDILLHGTIAPEQSDSYVMVPFDVPSDVRQVEVAVASAQQTKAVSWRPSGLAAGKPHWLRAEVHGPDGSLQLFSNPIYLQIGSH